ncbi:MAG: aldehyde ferredoxin oxidoreductase family protein [Planctomycetota bacterium]|nr:aldehyde ferredoxin oxidoreductase family protein [Planctomycetota bacterium]
MPLNVPGYHGQYLRVDLSTRTSAPISIPPNILRDFIGGAGLGTWLLTQETPGFVEALAPEAPLVFVFSPLVGSPLTTSAKFAVMSKSPLTERINDSLSSSGFAIAGKKTGFDAIVIVGAADGPTTLVIEPDTVRFADASRVWGQTVPESAKLLADELGRSFRTAVIGPAGENLVRFASVSHDGRHAARGGLGAVMGSKQLKAVAVRGDRLTEFAHPRELAAYAKQLTQLSFGSATEKYRELGTVSNLLTFNRIGALPTRNFQESTFAQVEEIAPEAMSASHPRTRASCAACTIGCEHIFQSPRANTGVRMEYENLFALGPLCGISDPDVVLHASSICDEVGIDTISAGATIAFAMECAERGLLTADELHFGNGEALIATLRDIGHVRGIGELLSKGSRAAAAEIGGGSEDFAPHVKGLELPGYEPRALQTMALGFAVGTRGADHNRSGAYQVDFSTAVDRLHISDDAPALAIETENEATLMDSLILCKFLRGVFEDKLASMAKMWQLVSGLDATVDQLKETANRIVTAKKRYNIQQGWTPAEDTLPKRFLSESIPDGPSSGASLTETRLKELIQQYNLQRGWSRDGWLRDESPTED